jgi:hypothetical protein
MSCLPRKLGIHPEFIQFLIRELSVRLRKLFVSSLSLALAMAGSMAGATQTTAAPANSTGFQSPFTGPTQYLGFAATQAKSSVNVNAALGQKRADNLAKSLGLSKKRSLSAMQYTNFASGCGVGGGTTASAAAAEVIVGCLVYQTDTNANPKAKSADGSTTYPHLGSYGLAVNEGGALESVANSNNPCMQVNVVLEPAAMCPPAAGTNPLNLPCGYMSNWMKANGASDTLAALYGSAYTAEASSASQSQQASGVAQLVANTKSGGKTSFVGMPLAPSVWLANFLILYSLSPELAAEMPAFWAPIPSNVATAIANSSTGQVPFTEFASSFKN